MKRGTFEMIPAVDASSFPSDVEEWCHQNEVSIHYQNDMTRVEDDGNPMAEWLKSIGVKFKKKDSKWDDHDHVYVAIHAT